MDNATITAKLNAIYGQIHELLKETEGQKFEIDEDPDLASDLAFLKYVTEETDDLMNTVLFDQYLDEYQA